MRWVRRARGRIGRRGVACRCLPGLHEVRGGPIVLRTATEADVESLLAVVDSEVADANGWRDDPAWIDVHLRTMTGRVLTGHDFIEHLLVEVRGAPAGVRSMYRRGDRLVTHGWMRAAAWRDHATELDAVTRFAHFHLGYRMLFAVAARDDRADRELLLDRGYTGPHRADRSVQRANGAFSALDVYAHRDRDAHHTCETLAGPGTGWGAAATVPPPREGRPQ